MYRSMGDSFGLSSSSLLLFSDYLSTKERERKGMKLGRWVGVKDVERGWGGRDHGQNILY